MNDNRYSLRKKIARKHIKAQKSDVRVITKEVVWKGEWDGFALTLFKSTFSADVEAAAPLRGEQSHYHPETTRIRYTQRMCYVTGCNLFHSVQTVCVFFYEQFGDTIDT